MIVFILSLSALLFYSHCRTFLFFVIAGLDPAIHKETGRVLAMRWIPGSQPGDDRKKKQNAKQKKRFGFLPKRFCLMCHYILVIVPND